MQEEKNLTEEQLKKAIADEQEAQSVLKHVLQLLQDKTACQKQNEEQHKIEQVKKNIAKV